MREAFSPRFALLLGACALAASSCGGTRDTRTTGPYYVAITNETPPALPPQPGEEGGVYQVRRSIPVPLMERPRGLDRIAPYPGGVWYTPSDLRVQLAYVISNLEDRDVTVELLVDGWNEHVYYAPQVRVTEEGVEADRSCADRLMVVPAKGRVSGRVSFDDFERMAAALAAILNKAPNSGHVLEPTTSFANDPLITPYIPAVIDGITGFDLSLRTTAPVRVAVEATVELVDLKGVLVDEGTPSSNRRPGRALPPTTPAAM